MAQPREPEAQVPAETDGPEQRILNLTPHSKSTFSVEEVLRQRIEQLAQAIRHKDVDSLMALYSPEVVAFDVRPPLEARGAYAYRENFVRWFDSFEGRI